MYRYTRSRIRSGLTGLLLASAALAAAPAVQAQMWEPTGGPSQGGLVRRTFVPGSATGFGTGDYWAAIYGAGVFKSSDGGNNWIPNNGTAPNLLNHRRVYDMVVNGGVTPYRAYAGTLGGGVYKTVDGGANWTQVNSGLGCHYVRTLNAPFPSTGTADTDVLLAGTGCLANSGIYRSVDGGATWAATSGVVSPNVTVNSIRTVAPAGNTAINLRFAATSDGIYISRDLGLNWTLTNGTGSNVISGPNGPNAHSVDFTYSAANGLTLMAAVEGGGVFKSTDEGANWTNVLAKPPIAGVGSDRDGNFYIGIDGEGVFRSADRGANWTSFIGAAAMPPVRSVNRIGTDTGSPSFVANTLSGVFKSGDGGATWSKISAGLPGGYTVNVQIDTRNANGDAYAAAADGVYICAGAMSANGNCTWAKLGGGNLGHMAQGGHINITPAGIYVITSNLGVFKLDEVNKTWGPMNSGLPSLIQQGGVLRGDPNNPTLGLWLGLADRGVYYSGDAGANWVAKSTGLTGAAMAVRYMATTPAMVLIATDGGLYKTTDNGANWTKLPFPAMSTTATPYPLVVDHIAVDGGTGGTGSIYAAVSQTNAVGATYPDNGVWKSADGGATWVQSAPMAGRKVHDIKVARTGAGMTLYAGVWEPAPSGGAWQSSDDGLTWTQITTGLTNNLISNFAIVNGVLEAVATYGGGVFGKNGSGPYSDWRFAGAMQDGNQTFYGVSYGANDPQQLLASVSISGGGQTANATYWPDNSWHADLHFGTTLPSLANVYTGTLTPKNGTPSTVTFQIDRFSTAFPSNLQPAGGQNVTTPPTFTWTAPTGNYNYKVDVSSATGNGGVIWSASNATPGVVYNGPPLVPGTQYKYWVNVSDYDNVSKISHGAGRAETFCFQCGSTNPTGANADQVFVGRNKNLPGGGESFGVSVRYPRQPNDQLKSAVLSCPGAPTSAYTFSASSTGFEWGAPVNFGGEPATPLNCTSTVTYTDNTINSKTVTVDRFSPASNHVSNISLQANANVTAVPDVTWTSPAGNFSFFGGIYTSNFPSPIWQVGPIAGSPIIYGGPALTPNTSYVYFINAMESGGGVDVLHAAQTWIPFCFQCTGGTTTSTTTSTTGTTTTTTGSTTTTTLAAAPSASITSGWNLLGNGLGNAITVSSVFGDSNLVTTVWKWIASSATWGFYTPTLSDGGAAYAASKGYTFLTTIEGGEGFWVNAKSAFTVPLAGTAVPISRYADGLTSNGLPAGWSLIAIGEDKTPAAFVNGIAVNPPAAGTSVATTLTTLWAWDAGVANWYFYAPTLVNAGTQAAYIASKGYLDFGTANKTLSPTTGFWVNHP